jgi:hypothetical protein
MDKPNIKPGDVIYFKECSQEMAKAKLIGFKGGWGFAVMLGIVPPFGKPPIEAQLMALMGSAGYMAFDDVANFLGEEQAKLCVKMFEEKYYKKILQKPNLILPESQT